MHLLRMAGLLLALLASSAYAGTPACDEVPDERKAFAAELLASQRPYDCCDDTIANCLEVTALSRRAQGVSAPGRKAKINLTGLSVAGDPRAPVTLVEYACPRCPYCATMTPKIYDAVVKGPLEGKVKLYFKTFPLRGHRGAKD